MNENKDSHEQDAVLRRWREWKREEEKEKEERNMICEAFETCENCSLRFKGEDCLAEIRSGEEEEIIW